MRRSVLLILIFIPLIFLGACSQDTSSKNPLRIGITEWIGYQPLSWAEQQYLNPDQAEVLELPSNTEIARLFNNGALDMICTPLGDALKLVQTNDDIVIIAILDISNGADTFLVQPEIDSLEALKGKRIGFEKDGAGTYMLVRILEKAGLKQDDVILKEVNFYNQENMYVQKKIDGLITYEPLSAKLESKGAKKIFDSSMIPDEIFDVLITNKKVLAKHPKKVKQVLDAWYRSASDITNKKPAFYNWLSSYLQLPLQTLYEQNAGIKYFNPDEFESIIYSEKFTSVLQQTKELLETSGQLESETDVSILVDRQTLGSLY